MHRPNQESRSTKHEIFMSLSLFVLSQSGPPKSVRWGGGGVGGGSGFVYHTSCGQYIGVAIFLSGIKLDEKSIENGLEDHLVMCLFWGGCHHLNVPDCQ